MAELSKYCRSPGVSVCIRKLLRGTRTGEPTLLWSVPVAKGSSKIEPAITPASDIVLEWDTWTDFEQDCGLSRLWGGVHFMPSIPAGQDVGHEIGDLAYEFVMDHIDGNVD